jgi:hypothetical protein
MSAHQLRPWPPIAVLVFRANFRPASASFAVMS